MVDIIITDDILVVSFPPDKLPINYLVSLVTDESVKRFNDRPQIQALRNWHQAILTCRRSVVFVRALKDGAQAFGGESNLGRVTLAKKIERNLPQAVVP